MFADNFTDFHFNADAAKNIQIIVTVCGHTQTARFITHYPDLCVIQVKYKIEIKII